MSYAYPVVPGDERAALATALGAVETALARVAEAGISAFVLSTCLRMEIAVPAPAGVLDDALALLFREVPTLQGSDHRSGTEAVEHLFRIAAGLESPIVGEREILVQFRQATAAAVNNGDINGSFRGLLDAAIATARAVRDVLPTDPRQSMAELAASLTPPVDRVGVLGYGAMGRSVVEALLALPRPPAVEVFSRRRETINTPGVVARSLTEVPLALQTLPAVISATSAKTRLIPAEELTDVLSGRAEPLTLIDMAMPPDFSPPAGAAIRYHNIDDLADLAREHPNGAGMDHMVADAAAKFTHKVQTAKRSGALIEHLFDHAETAVDEAVNRFAGRLATPSDRELLEQAARAATRKVLHKPATFLSGEGADEAEIVAAAFGIKLND